ncbi:hypothetical protein DFP72DRAFT_198710 [Ephemerocybe angulata]|uniref:Uncharacterized protein n=1 Tax=Ephemerocybe angulata TaxID=980116 RepID=A0A8H6HA97_9AGAR|nr:hypothetical protein DFP72DRAFT_198710 [Tulosesus angulatus]
MATTFRHKHPLTKTRGRSLRSAPSSASLEPRLFALQLDTLQHHPTLALIDPILTKLEPLDERMIVTEGHPLESLVYRGMGNFPKNKENKACGTHLLSYRSQLDLLSSPPPFCGRSPVWYPLRRGQGLH